MKCAQVVSCLTAMSTPAVFLRKAKESGGFSKLGGLPNLPAGMEWPSWEWQPLAFIAQLDLAEVAAPHGLTDMPQSGRLYFFYDQKQSALGFSPKHAGGWRVLYSEEAPSPTPVPAPPGLEQDTLFEQKFLQAVPMPSFPHLDRAGIDISALPDAEYEEVCDTAQGLKTSMFGNEPQHQLGGYPNPVQNDDMEMECQLASNGFDCGGKTNYPERELEPFKAGAEDWKLLLQVDSDDDTDMMWGDTGMLYFWIRKQDLQARDFSKVWLNLQCS